MTRFIIAPPRLHGFGSHDALYFRSTRRRPAILTSIPAATSFAFHAYHAWLPLVMADEMLPATATIAASRRLL